jgi:hypothetical protein
MDVARTKVSSEDGDHSVEWFAIYFDDLSNTSANMILRWGDAVVSVPISVK